MRFRRLDLLIKLCKLFIVISGFGFVFLQLLVKRLAALFQFLLGLPDFRSAVFQQLFKLLQPLLVLLPAFIQLFAGGFQCLAELLAQLRDPRLCQRILGCEDVICVLFYYGQITPVKAADLRRIVQQQPCIGIDLGIKCLRRHQHKAVNLPVSDRRGAAFKIDMPGGISPADHGEFRFFQQRFRTLGNHCRNRIPDRNLRRCVHLNQTFIRPFGHPPLCQHGLIDLLPFLFAAVRQTVNPDNRIRGTLRHRHEHRFLIPAADLCDIAAFCKQTELLIAEPCRRPQVQIHQSGLAVIAVGRGFHVGAGHFQSGEKPGADCDYPEQRKKPLLGTHRAPQCIAE